MNVFLNIITSVFLFSSCFVKEDLTSGGELIYNVNENQNITNDNNMTAQSLFDSSFYQHEKFSIHFEGVLESSSCAVYDYYFFNIYTDSNISITGYDNNNYSFSLYRYDTKYVISNNSNFEGHRVENYIFTKNTTDKLNYNFNAKSGTYIIVVYKTTNTHNNYNYSFKIGVNQYKNRNDINLHKILKSNLDYILWVSDYIPYGIDLRNLDKPIKYYEYNSNYLGTNDYSLYFLKENANLVSYRACNLYIINPTLKETLHSIIFDLKQELNKNYNNEKTLKADLELKVNFVSNVLEISALINDTFNVNLPTKTCIKMSIDLTEALLNNIIDLIIPKENIDKYFYIQYLDLLLYSLLYSEDDSVVEIPVFYALKENNNVFSKQEKYVSYDITYQEYCNLKTLIVKGDTIDVNQTKTAYSKGNFYTLIDTNTPITKDNIKPLSNIYDYIPHNHICTDYKQYSDTHHKIVCHCGHTEIEKHIFNNHYCELCKSYIKCCDYVYKYEWINKNAHYSFCICGNKISQPHIVKSMTRDCLLCNGEVDMAFVIS